MTFDLISGLHRQIQTWHPPLWLCTHAKYYVKSGLTNVLKNANKTKNMHLFFDSDCQLLRSNYTDISVSFSPGEFPLQTNGKLHVSIFILHESLKTDIKARTIVCPSIIVQSCRFVGPCFQRCISLKKVGQFNPSYTINP